MPEIEQPKSPDGGPYYPIPPQGCEHPGVTLRDRVAEKTFVRLLGDAFQAQMGQRVEINANDFAVQAFNAADAFLRARAVM